MLATIAEISVSPSATNPGAGGWTDMFKAIGFEGGFAVLLLAFFLLAFVLFCVLIYRIASWLFAENGWLHTLAKEGLEKFNTFLTDLQTKVADNASDLEHHVNKCESMHGFGGPCNVTDIREAGHEFAEIARELSGGTPTVGNRVDNIHRILRGRRGDETQPENAPVPVKG
jgi:hypothetical protein